MGSYEEHIIYKYYYFGWRSKRDPIKRSKHEFTVYLLFPIWQEPRYPFAMANHNSPSVYHTIGCLRKYATYL